MSHTNTIGFSFKVESVMLQTIDDTLRTTGSFVTRNIIEQLNEKLKAQNFKVDESSVRPKYTGDQLYLEGLAIEIKEPKTVGFLSGR